MNMANDHVTVSENRFGFWIWFRVAFKCLCVCVVCSCACPFRVWKHTTCVCCVCVVCLHKCIVFSNISYCFSDDIYDRPGVRGGGRVPICMLVVLCYCCCNLALVWFGSVQCWALDVPKTIPWHSMCVNDIPLALTLSSSVCISIFVRRETELSLSLSLPHSQPGQTQWGWHRIFWTHIMYKGFGWQVLITLLWLLW